MLAHALKRACSRHLARRATPIAGGIGASLAAGAVMLLMRLLLQVRTVPERALEALLLLTPPDVFEAALLRFGYDAKRLGLVVVAVVMLILLAALGGWAIQRRWSIGALTGTGLILWVFVMVVIMPATGAGLFALDLVDGTNAVIGTHVAAALTYVAVLTTVIALVDAGTPAAIRPGAQTGTQRPEITPTLTPSVAAPSRRAALILSAGAVSSAVVTYLAAQWGQRSGPTRIVVVDSSQLGTAPGVASAVTVPTAAPTRPAPTPTQIADRAIQAPAVAPSATPPPPTAAVAEATSVPPTPAPTVAVAPRGELEPPPIKQLSRDKDGTVLASGRRPGQLADALTPTDHFYVVSKNAAQDPVVDVNTWRLRIDGDVQRAIEIDYRSLRTLPATEVTKTLECVSNFVTNCELAPFGCDLISTARWKGVRLRDTLTLAGGLTPGVTTLTVVSADDYTSTLPIEVALDPETLLVYEMNGGLLPREHGYPARILVPGRYGMKNAKWVIALQPRGRMADDWYGQRGWTKDGVVKTMSRIDVPARNAALPPGEHRIAGIAYGGERGIRRVELSADGGNTWRDATVFDRPAGRDVWVRWEGSFTLPPGASLTLMSRATDGQGELQEEAFSLPQPDGSSGWHSLEIRATEA